MGRVNATPVMKEQRKGGSRVQSLWRGREKISEPERVQLGMRRMLATELASENRSLWIKICDCDGYVALPFSNVDEARAHLPSELLRGGV